MTNEIRRYGWFRVYEGVPSHPVWMRAANVVGCSVADTLAVGIWLMTVASKGRPRGNLENFDAEACAAVLRIPTERVEAIHEALKGGKKPWIDRDRILDWDDRNPKSDATSSERQHRFRERHRETRNALQGASNALRNVTERYIPPRYVTVTDRDSDSKLIESSTLVLEQAGNSMEPGDPVAEAPPEVSKGTGEGNPEPPPVAKPPHMVGRAELDVIVEQKRIAREAMLEEKRELIRKGYGKA